MMDACGRCFKCREGRGCIRAISIAPSATPSRGGGAEAARINATDARWDKDMPAYKRLRWNGLQPKQIDHCAELESRATDSFEIEMGTIVPKHRRSQVKEGLAIAKELEVTPDKLQRGRVSA